MDVINKLSIICGSQSSLHKPSVQGFLNNNRHGPEDSGENKSRDCLIKFYEMPNQRWCKLRSCVSENTRQSLSLLFGKSLISKGVTDDSYFLCFLLFFNYLK